MLGILGLLFNRFFGGLQDFTSSVIFSIPGLNGSGRFYSISIRYLDEVYWENCAYFRLPLFRCLRRCLPHIQNLGIRPARWWTGRGRFLWILHFPRRSHSFSTILHQVLLGECILLHGVAGNVMFLNVGLAAATSTFQSHQSRLTNVYGHQVLRLS